MGTPGVAHDITTDQLRQSIVKNKGLVKLVCEELNYCYRVVVRLINENPELVELLKEMREIRHEYALDTAEKTLIRQMEEHHKDESLAQKAATFFISKKGYMRGFKDEEKEVDQDEKEAWLEYKAIAGTLKKSQFHRNPDAIV